MSEKEGAGGRQGSAVWVWKDSSVTVANYFVCGACWSNRKGSNTKPKCAKGQVDKVTNTVYEKGRSID